MRKPNGQRPERLTATAVVTVVVALLMSFDLGAGAGPTRTPERAIAANPNAAVVAPALSARTTNPRAARRNRRTGTRPLNTQGTIAKPTTAPSTTSSERTNTSSNTDPTIPTDTVPPTFEPALSTNTAAPTPTTGAPEPLRTMYWGASVGSQLTGEQAPWDMNAVTRFESLAGKPMSIVHWNDEFYSSSDCNGYCEFDAWIFSAVRNHGSIPMVTWASQPATGRFTDAQIAAGSQDSYIRAWATAAKQWGHPLFLRFDWEMNGSWFPWAVGSNGNTAADYVAMWRHVHDVFIAAGATNVSWVWCPNVDLNHLAPLASLYPGDAYVDWTGLDGYNWGTNPAGHNGGWETFDQIYYTTYHTIVDTIAPSKPMMVGETGSTEYGGSKSAWITDMLTVQLPRNYPKIQAVMWFDRGGAEADNMDWPIESSAAATKAFATGIGNPMYSTNRYTSISGRISPP